MVPDEELGKGNAVSLMLNCSSEKEIKMFYQKLSEGGNPTHPLENTHWNSIFGNLIDKYGNHWLLHYDKKLKQKSL